MISDVSEKALVFAPSRTYGVNSALTGSLFYIDARRLVHFAGKYLVFHDTHKNTQQFVAILPPQKLPVEAQQSVDAVNVVDQQQQAPLFDVTAVTLSESRLWLALCVRKPARDDHGATSTLHIYDTTKRSLARKIDLAHSATEIVSLSFSGDGRFLAALTASPNQSVLVWRWETGKLHTDQACAKFIEASTRRPDNRTHGAPVDSQGQVRSISFQPSANSPYMLTLIGDHIFRVLKFQPELPVALRAPSVEVPHYKTYLNCVWLGDKAILGTSDGSLLCCGLNETKIEIEWRGDGLSPKLEGVQAGGAVQCIARYAGGILIAVKAAVVALSLHDNDKGVMVAVPLKTWDFSEFAAGDDSYHVKAITVSTNQDAVACMFNTNEVRVGRTAGEPFTESFDLGEHMFSFQPLMPIVHAGEVIQMQSCMRKAWIASAEHDGLIRVWNYHEQSVVASRSFPDKCLDVSFHPSGCFLVAAFLSGTKLLAVLNDELIEINHHFGSGCRKVRFSHGGHYYAYSNEGAIAICNTWQPKQVRRVATGLERVRFMEWRDFDDAVVASDGYGKIFEWSMAPGADGPAQRTILYNSAARTLTKASIAAFHVSTLREKESSIPCCLVSHLDGRIVLERNGTLIWTQVLQWPIHSFTALPQKCLYGTTHCGKVLRLPTISQLLSIDATAHLQVTCFSTHAAGITAACITPDLMYFLTASQTGSIQVHSISAMDPMLLAADQGLMSDEILVTKRSFIQCLDEVKLLETSDTLFTAECAAELARKTDDNQRVQQSLQNGNDQTLTTLRSNNDQKREEIDELKGNNERSFAELRRKNKDAHAGRKAEIDLSLKRQVHQHDELSQRLDSNIEGWERQAKAFKAAEATESAKEVADGERKLAALAVEKTQLQSEVQRLQSKLEMFDRDLEGVVEEEVLQMLNVNEHELVEAKAETAKARQETKKLKATMNELLASANLQKKEIASRQESNRQLQEVVAALQHDVQRIQGEMSLRYETEKEKERRYDDENRVSTDLKKLRFLLETKHKSEVDNMIPRLQKLADVQKQATAMRNEVEKMRATSEDLQRDNHDFGDRHRGLVAINNRMRLRTRALQTVYKQMCHEFNQIVHGQQIMQPAGAADRQSYVRMQKRLAEFYHRLCPDASRNLITVPKGYVPENRSSVTTEDNTVAHILKLCESIPAERNLDSLSDIDKCISEILRQVDEVSDSKKKREMLETELVTISGRVHEQEHANRLNKLRLTQQRRVMLHELTRVHSVQQQQQ